MATTSIAKLLHSRTLSAIVLFACEFLATSFRCWYVQAATFTTRSFQTAASVLALSPKQLDHHDPAHLRGVVIRCTEYGVVVVDRTGGIWVNYNHSAKEFSTGDELDVVGVTSRGLYSPVVNARTIRKLGRAALPRPTKVNFRQMSTGDYDAQYITLSGTVRSAGLRPNFASSQSFWMKVEMSDGMVFAAFPGDCTDAGSKLIGAVVQLTGAGSSAKNRNMQITIPALMMSSMDGVRVLRPPPADLFSVPLTPIGKLMQYRSGTDYYHRVRVAGTVTYYKPGESIIIEDTGNALYAETPQFNSIKIGDRVEALGFLAPRDTGPILQDAIIRDIAPGQQSLPAAVTPADLSTGRFNYNFVSAEGRLLRTVREPSREVLLIQDQSSLLLAELAESGNSDAFHNLLEGSTIRISGISILEITGTWNAGGPAASSIRYRVLLRSPDDVRVIQPPSWWSKTHIAYIAGVLAFLVLLFLALIVYGRMEGWRLQAVLGERERLANEVHDTLAQSFAGIGFQLQAVRKAISVEQTELAERIDLARALVRLSHKEARLSIEPISPETFEEGDLLSALETSARTMLEGGAVKVNTKITGTPRPLPPKVAISLLRIGQEAIANAVRHADPRSLEISLTYESDFVRLAVRDDGCGFVKSGGLLGFGLRGMRKRAAALSAKLDIISRPGEGTCVEVTAPVPPDHGLITFVQHTYKYFSENILHVDAKPK